MPPEFIDRGDSLDPVVADDAAAIAAAAAAAAAAQADVDAELTAKAAEEAAEAEKLAAEEAEKVAEQERNEKGQFQPKDAKIPKARFDEAVGKERDARLAAETRAATLEARLKEREASVGKVTKLDEMETAVTELEKSYAKLMLDGNEEGAAKVMKEIRLAERQIAKAEARADTAQEIQQVLEGERLTVAIAKLEADYPELNDKSEAYDDDLTELVLSKQQTLITREGLSPSQALTKAAADVMGRFATKVAEGAGVAKKGLSAAAQAVEDRTKAQIAKNLATAKNQPSSLKEVGMDSDKAGATSATPDVNKLSADEFAALPEAVKARMRGDTL